jgi:uncharacterized protein (TIGR00303 family)
MSALRLAHIPILVVNAGSKMKPTTPFIELCGSPGNNIRTGRVVERVEQLYQNASSLSEQLAETSDYLVVGESIPSGTTTTLGVLSAMGFDARGRVSSSMPNNLHQVRIETLEKRLREAHINPGNLRENSLRAIECVGDPMIAAVAGMTAGASKKNPMLPAGGTQMTSVLATLPALNRNILRNVAIGTTRWIAQDPTSDIKGLVSQIVEIAILAADLDFSSSGYAGLKAYESGVVKEGVGAGGSVIAAIAKSRGSITMKQVVIEIERNYGRLIGAR